MEILAIMSAIASIFGGAVKAGELTLKYVKFKAPKKKEVLKDEVAFIIDFGTFSIEESVKRYLKANRMDPTIVVCTNPNGFVHLELEDSDVWQRAVEQIYVLISEVASAAPKKIHIFMNAPVALTFALGYVLRPCAPYVYQFNNAKTNTADSKLYSLVLHANDSLKGDARTRSLVAS